MRAITLSACSAILMIMLLALPATARADADVIKPPVDSADFNLGSDAIKSRDWKQAIYHLEIVVRTEAANADVQNLLGYAYRNLGNYDAAFRHYAEALRLDSKHRGAHEYVGEAYLQTGNKAKAQEHLAALERICGKGCEEYQDLARAIAQSK